MVKKLQLQQKKQDYKKNGEPIQFSYRICFDSVQDSKAQ